MLEASGKIRQELVQIGEGWGGRIRRVTYLISSLIWSDILIFILRVYNQLPTIYRYLHQSR